MRLGHVIGTVTLATADPALRGGSLLLVQPFTRDNFAGAPALPLAPGSTTVVYDTLGAGIGQIIGFTEGAEATAPFDRPVPIDAYAAAIIDRIHYDPSTS